MVKEVVQVLSDLGRSQSALWTNALNPVVNIFRCVQARNAPLYFDIIERTW